jgi:hypothetical protein
MLMNSTPREVIWATFKALRISATQRETPPISSDKTTGRSQLTYQSRLLVSVKRGCECR